MFNLFGKKTEPNINSILDDMKEEPAIRLVDVRTKANLTAATSPAASTCPLIIWKPLTA